MVRILRDRRRWTPSEKAAIVAESFAPGASVSEVAQRHGMNPNQLSTWRRSEKVPLTEHHDADLPNQRFVPLIASKDPGCVAGPATVIEVVAGSLVIRLDGSVDAGVLQRVLEAARRSL